MKVVGILGILVGLAVAGALYQAVGAKRRARQLTPPGRLIDVGGHRLHTVCRGQGDRGAYQSSGHGNVKAIVVPRGMSPAYYTFMRITAKANGMDLIIDRRVRDRRREFEQTSIERRVHDRRRRAPIMWTRDGFLVVPRAKD